MRIDLERKVIKLDQSLLVLCSFPLWGQNHDSRFAGVSDEKPGAGREGEEAEKGRLAG